MLSEEELKQWDELLSVYPNRSIFTIDRKNLLEFLTTIRELRERVAELEGEQKAQNHDCYGARTSIGKEMVFAIIERRQNEEWGAGRGQASGA